MTRAIITDGLGDADTEPQLLLILDAPDAPGEQAVVALGDHGYEGDNALYVVATDGWVEQELGGDRLTSYVVAYPREGTAIDAFTERSELDADARRLLRVTSPVDPEAYARLGDAVLIWFAEAGDSDERVIDAINEVEEWPLVLSRRTGAGSPTPGAPRR